MGVRGSHHGLWAPGRGTVRLALPDLPDGFVPRALDVIADQPLVGGRSDAPGSALWRCDLASPQGWQRMELPEELAPAGKPVDALVHDAERLYTVDDLARPRWLVVHDLSRLHEPAVHVGELPTNGPREHFHAAAAAGGYLALLSTSQNRGQRVQHVTVVETAKYTPVGTTCGSLSPPLPYVPNTLDDSREVVPERVAAAERFVRNPPGVWTQAVVVGERVLVAAGRSGLLEVAARGRRPRMSAETFAPLAEKRPRMYWLMVPAWSAARRLRPPVAGAVSQVVALPDDRLAWSCAGARIVRCGSGASMS